MEAERLLDGVRILTFDCYGTLIDWEAGLLAALRSVFEREGIETSDEDLLESYADLEQKAEQAYRPYRDVLREVMEGLCEQHGFTLTAEDRDLLVRDLPLWPPFDDTIPALKRLHERYAIGIISNIDRDLFSGTAEVLEVPFDWVTTAQDAGAYKPDPMVFAVAMQRMGATPGEVLHVAQSLFHDIAPASESGIRTVWVDRRAGMDGTGATPASHAEPDLTVADLAGLAEVVERAAD